MDTIQAARAVVMEDLKSLSIKELKGLISKAGLTTAGCTDKADLIERAEEAQQKLAAGGGDGADAEAIEAEVAALPITETLPILERSIKGEPSQTSALRANACLERITKAFMGPESSVAELPHGRLLSAVLGSLKMGLGGQGGLFMMACLLLPLVLAEREEEDEDLSEMVQAAEQEHDADVFETLLAGLAKFEREEVQNSILVTLRQWLGCQVEHDGGDDFVAVEESTAFEMLNAGMMPLVLRAMRTYPANLQIADSGVAVISAICGLHPSVTIAEVIAAAGTLDVLVAALSSHASDLEFLAGGIALLKALTTQPAGKSAAKRYVVRRWKGAGLERPNGEGRRAGEANMGRAEGWGGQDGSAESPRGVRGVSEARARLAVCPPRMVMCTALLRGRCCAWAACGRCCIWALRHVGAAACGSCCMWELLHRHEALATVQPPTPPTLWHRSGAAKGLQTLLRKHPNEPELQREVTDLAKLLTGAVATGGGKGTRRSAQTSDQPITATYLY